VRAGSATSHKEGVKKCCKTLILPAAMGNLWDLLKPPTFPGRPVDNWVVNTCNDRITA
jgi:hypothetical protein